MWSESDGTGDAAVNLTFVHRHLRALIIRILLQVSGFRVEPVPPLADCLFIYFHRGTSSLFSFHGLLQAQFTSRRDDWQVVIAMMTDQVADAFEYVIFSSYLLKIKTFKHFILQYVL